ncbi:MAG: RagB/SusD family nutrient uptake outer membrane protein [Cyclobacteriaceae bacterium]
MKTNKISILSILALTVAFCGCDEDKFLTQVNPNQLTEATFWSSEADANAALTTVYAALQLQSVSGGDLNYEMVKSDLGGTNDWTRHFDYTELSVSDVDGPVERSWAELYIGIFRANQVIRLVPGIEEDDFTDEEKTLIVAQARFLRAFFYFEIAYKFGQGVITTTSTGTDEDIHIPLSTQQEIIDQVIMPDLEFALENLPSADDLDNDDMGRVTWGAAKTLQGKIYLYAQDWDAAAAAFLEVIQSGSYSLVSDPLDNFNHTSKFNSESIFEVPFDGEINAGSTDTQQVDDTPFNTGSESSTMARWFAPYSLAGWQVVMPTYFAHELMLADSVSGSSDRSARYNVNVVGSRDNTIYYYDQPSVLRAEVGRRWGFGESAYIKKYTNWYHQDDEGVEWRTSINFKHMRLADVYLMYAEAVLESTGDIATAIEYIDRVRSRAGVVLLQDYIDANGTIPQLHVSAELYGTRPQVAPTLENIRTHLRMVERPTELCYENTRWRDLVRWDIVQSVMESHLADENIRVGLGPNENRPPLHIAGRIRPDFVNVGVGNYDPETDNYFPIPSIEVQNNQGF